MNTFVCSDPNARIAVTQPRRMAAVNLAKHVASLRGVALGDEVGYRISMESQANRRRTRVVYMTTGFLLACLVYHPEEVRASLKRGKPFYTHHHHHVFLHTHLRHHQHHNQHHPPCLSLSSSSSSPSSYTHWLLTCVCMAISSSSTHTWYLTKCTSAIWTPTSSHW